MTDLSSLPWVVAPTIVAFLGTFAVYLLGFGLLRRI